MKHILQDLKNGNTYIEEVPVPGLEPNTVLIRSNYSLISPGTERMLINFGKAGLLSKAKQQPDKVREVLDKVKADGLVSTMEAVSAKLGEPIALGYSNAGVVIESASPDFKVGDRVISNGNHAEVVKVSSMLCAKIPANVQDSVATFTVVASIGLQSVRLFNPTLGEKVVVIGLGLVGLLTVQILIANGCSVIGIDTSAERCRLAESFGANTVLGGPDSGAEASAFLSPDGADGVIIAASSSSNEIMHQAATLCRKRGRVILVGVVGLNLSRDDFFKKEITFQVSASYGPGRYDPEYEVKCKDYPIGFVRWTEKRNFEAVLGLMAKGQLKTVGLVTCQCEIADASEGYKLLEGRESLAILITYPGFNERASTYRSVLAAGLNSLNNESDCRVVFVGAGNYASRVLIPALKKCKVQMHTLVSNNGLSGTYNAKKFGFKVSSTDLKTSLNSEEVNTVFVSTRHNLHKDQVVVALQAGKHVFVEKPLALTLLELDEIDVEYKKALTVHKSKPLLMIGFNRRFSPHVLQMKALLSDMSEPKGIFITVNAGKLPTDHWTKDIEIGGGRIVGEGCHFIDLARHLVGKPIVEFNAIGFGNNAETFQVDDTASISLSFADGSLAVINYITNGSRAFPKERVEVFCSGRVLQLDNFRKLRGYGWQKKIKSNLFSQNKGQTNCVKEFIESIKSGKSSPIPYEELMEVSRVSIQISELLNNRNY